MVTYLLVAEKEPRRREKLRQQLKEVLEVIGGDVICHFLECAEDIENSFDLHPVKPNIVVCSDPDGTAARQAYATHQKARRTEPFIIVTSPLYADAVPRGALYARREDDTWERTIFMIGHALTVIA